MSTIELHPGLACQRRPRASGSPDASRSKRAAREVRLSGGKGVHVVVPLSPGSDWDEVRCFCEGLRVDDGPRKKRYVATMSKAKRRGRIFIDGLRNGRGATSVAAWSFERDRGRRPA